MTGSCRQRYDKVKINKQDSFQQAAVLHLIYCNISYLLCSVIDAPWYQPSADPADFFNYGLNSRTWKEYCESVKKYQTEFSMQRQIEVYDRDGRANNGQQDMPPELAAAVAQRRAVEGPHRPAQQASNTPLRLFIEGF